MVGRTGAGKSTLVLALFRLRAYSGRILLDGRELQSLGLERVRPCLTITNPNPNPNPSPNPNPNPNPNQVRQCITIIPQDPVLHSGTVAHNLDPFDGTPRPGLLA